MLREETGIGPGLFFMVMYVTLFSYGVTQSPYVAAEYMGNNGYWGFLLAFFLAVPAIALINALGRKFPRKSVILYLPEVFGTIPGKLLGVIYLLFVTTLMTWSSRAISEIINTYFLSRTPVWALVFVFLAVAGYAAHQGIEGISRLAAFAFPVTFVLSLAAIVFSFQTFEIDNIRPAFSIDGLSIPIGTAHMFYPFVPLLTGLTIYPYLTEKQKGFRILFGAALLSFVLIFLVILSGIGSYSAPGLLRYAWPVIELTRKANVPFLLQTFGLFFAATWLTQALVGTGFFYYVLAQGAAELTNVLNYKWFTLILFPVLFALILIPAGEVEIRFVFPYLRLTGFALTLGFPLLILLMASIRKRGDGKNAA